MASSVILTEKIFKVLVIGDPGVGKSSIVQRYVNKRFDEKYKPSVGVDFALKTLEWNGIVVRVQLWDIAGECHNYEFLVVIFGSRILKHNHCEWCRFYHLKSITPVCAISVEKK